MNVRKMLELAAQVANLKVDGRTFRHGAVAVRDDGVSVHSYNGFPGPPLFSAHCEARLVRKLDKGATVYLVRTLKNGDWANTMPCAACQRALKRAKVKKLYYTTGPGQWDSLSFS